MRETNKAAAGKSKKVTVDIPQSLFDAATRMSSGRHLTTSALVREAMEYYVEVEETRRLERELEEGYLATADISERLHREFEHVDAENR